MAPLIACLSDFFAGIENKEIIVIKLGTNGLVKNDAPLPSVLSVAAARYVLRLRRQIEFLGQFERYYLPTEDYDPKAIAVNGLDETRITSKRQGCNYPKHFKDDADSLTSYCSGVHLFVGHNIDLFEAKFLPWLTNSENKTFDLMKESVNIVCLEPDDCTYSDSWKWPTLYELLHFYGIPIPDEYPMSGITSVKSIAAIFQVMLSYSGIRRIRLTS